MGSKYFCVWGAYWTSLFQFTTYNYSQTFLLKPIVKSLTRPNTYKAIRYL